MEVEFLQRKSENLKKHSELSELGLSEQEDHEDEGGYENQSMSNVVESSEDEKGKKKTFIKIIL